MSYFIVGVLIGVLLMSLISFIGVSAYDAGLTEGRKEGRRKSK